MPRPAPSRRGFLLATAGAGAALGLAAGPRPDRTRHVRRPRHRRR
ncbi:twin-arginine translocation signal domain-containing protein [Streptomyces flaveolus]